MNIRQRSVNVSRVELLEKLKQNLELHRAEYKEALAEFHTRLLEDLKLAQKKVSKVENVEDLKNFHLDSESFRAYIKNEWQWQATFAAAKMAYATVGSSLTL